MKYCLIVIFYFFTWHGIAQEAPAERFYSSLLQRGEVLRLGDNSVKFLEVVSDSRCPEGVTCIWAGEAKVRIGIVKNGEVVDEQLIVIASGKTFSLDFPAEEIVYSIHGMDLKPLPSVSSEEPKPGYTLEVRFAEKIIQEE